MNRRTLIGLVLLLAALPGVRIDGRMFLACWLAAWWWCLGLVLGTFANAWIHRLSGGAWGLAFQPLAHRLAVRLPWLLLLFAPVVGGLPLLYPWAAHADGSWAHGLSRPGFVLAWLSPTFFQVRLAGYALAWWWLTRPSSFDEKARAAKSLLVHAIVTSLAAVDLVMSLLPSWYSTAFGLIALCEQALAGAALSVLCAAWWQPRLPSIRPGQPPLSRDLGNLLLMWTMIWGYLAFMQFLIIWAENLPREIGWYLPRLRTGWKTATQSLVLLQGVLPFLALLLRAVKDRPERLAVVASLMLAASALDAAWLVLPSVAPHSLHGWWLLPLVFTGMALLLFGGLDEELDEAATSSSRGTPRHAHP